MKKQRKKTGFTLVELLTVISIIAVLIGILVPALNMAKKLAKDLNQKAQLHSIAVGLDMFRSDSELGNSFPSSTVRGGGKTGILATSPYTTGAQHLAEALVGRDMLGFDTKSSWDASEDNKLTTDMPYASTNPPWSASAQEETASLARRKGPYINAENVDAYSIAQLYTTTRNVYKGYKPEAEATDTPSPVLTDVFRIKDVTLANGKVVKAGSPILYYKANTSPDVTKMFPNTKIIGGSVPIATTILDADTDGYIYNSMDNEDLIELGHLLDPLNKHHFDEIGGYIDPATTKGGRWTFYDTITNPEITSQPRPYNVDSYLLISAGYDGLYGTKDDVKNFGE